MQKFSLLVLLLFCSFHSVAQTLGTYPAVTTRTGRGMLVNPSAAPTSVDGILVTTDPAFQGVLTGSPLTGKIRIVNPKPAGVYTIKVKGYNTSGGTVTKFFQLTVTGADCSVGDLSAGTIVTTGLNQVMTVIGDFNQDGIQDFAGAHEGGNNTLSIRMGTGTGTFYGTTELPVGSHPYNAVIGDFDRNGTQDLVTVNSGDNSITPISGAGNGNFTVMPVCDVGTSPISIIMADFDGDGKPDIATANLNANSVSIRQGNGAGFFYGTNDIPVGLNPYHIALADFNHDGKADFATANSAGNDVSIRLGNGAGGFTTMPNVPVGLNPVCVAIADFNEDGLDDIATANYMINTVSIRFGDGAGNFYGNSEIPSGLGAYFLNVGNFNGDDHLDFIVANYFDNTISVRFGDGTGGFVNGNDVAVGSYPTGVSVGEFNNDHYMDALVSNFQDGEVSVHLGLAGNPPVDSIRTNSPVCEGTNLELWAFGGVNYTWSGPNGFLDSVGYTQRFNIAETDSGFYNVTIEDSGHCVANETLHVTVYPSPTVAFFVVNDTFCSGSTPVQLIGGYPPGGLYVGTGMFGNWFDPQFAGPGEYTINYVFSDEHDCSASDSEKVWVVICLGTEDVAENSLNIFPNPASHEVQFEIQTDKAEAFIYSSDGRLIRNMKLHYGRQTVSVNDLPVGLYTVRILEDDKLYVGKIIKE
jgi:hypothetical protein